MVRARPLLMLVLAAPLLLGAGPAPNAPPRVKRQPSLWGAGVPADPAQWEAEHVRFLHKFCPDLATAEAPLDRAAEQRPAIPDWHPLRWGLPVEQVRWALGQQRLPFEIDCFAKTATPYLKLQRPLGGGAPAPTAVPWKGTLYFEHGHGLKQIDMAPPAMATERELIAIRDWIQARYGPATGAPGYRDERSAETHYSWTVGGTQIRLFISRYQQQPGGHLTLGYRRAPTPTSR